MRANRFHLVLALGIALLSAFECYSAYPDLPDPMASNFGGDGRPGGWSSRRAFMTIHTASTLFWLGALLGVPYMVKRIRAVLTQDDEDWLRDTTGWFLIASLCFSAAVTHLVLEANLVTGRLSGAFVGLLLGYSCYAIFWTVRLIRRLRRINRS